MSQLKIVTKILGIGLEALPLIDKPVDKVMAAAALLNSIAEVRKTKSAAVEAEETEEALTEEGGRMSLSPDASVEAVQPAENAVEEAINVNEWNDDALDSKGVVDQFVASWGKELVSEYYAVFTNNVHTDVDELMPLDAAPFVNYLYEVSAQAEADAAAAAAAQ